MNSVKLPDYVLSNNYEGSQLKLYTMSRKGSTEKMDL
jgi:hypothetical protein